MRLSNSVLVSISVGCDAVLTNSGLEAVLMTLMKLASYDLGQSPEVGHGPVRCGVTLKHLDAVGKLVRLHSDST